MEILTPSLYDSFLTKIYQNGEPVTDLQDFKDSFKGGVGFKSIIHGIWSQLLYGQAAEGNSAPNPPLTELNGFTQKHLLDFAKHGRPLVVNFGSCTWPVFLKKFALFKEIVRDFSRVADFLMVYVEEAHAADGWAYKSLKHRINKHKIIQERIAAAGILAGEEPGCAIVVDTMENLALKQYSATPERYCIILGGQVVYFSGQAPMGYKPEEVRQWLENFCVN